MLKILFILYFCYIIPYIGFAKTSQDITDFNEGCAQYKEGDFNAAVDKFSNSSLSEDRSLETRSYYNLGNSKYRLGSAAEQTNLQEALNLYKEAGQYYLKAIEGSGEDKDAKYNYEFARNKIKELEAKIQQQPQDKQQQKDEQKAQGEKNQEKKDESVQPEKEEKTEEQKEQTVDNQKDGQELSQDGRNTNDETDEMTEQEAKMLLESFSQREMLGGILRDKQQSKDPDIYKDW